MHRRHRRTVAVGVTLLILLAAAASAVVGAVAGDRERVGEIWVAGRLDSGGLRVIEVIDYDFGYERRHGIYRDIPDLEPGAPVVVASPTAPDEVLLTPGYNETNVRIGDPGRTIWQRHRYEIGFTLARAAVVNDRRFAWDAIGTDWTVGTDEVTIHLALGAEVSDLRCDRGDPWDSRSCTATRDATGLITVRLSDLGAGDAVTIRATLGPSSVAPAVPAAPAGPATDPGTGIAPIVAVTLVAGAVAAVPARILTRRAGREQVWDAGPVDIAFAEGDEGHATTRMSEREMAEFVTVEFEPPRGMSAVEGGLILDERIRGHHLTAWLLESAIRNEVELDGPDDKPVLRRGSATPEATVAPILETIFKGRSSVELGAYDPSFTSGWNKLKTSLERWAKGLDHWDRAGHRRQTATRVLSVVVAAIGLAVAGVGGAVANTSGTPGLWIAAAGGALAGGAGAALASSWTLLVRTPQGSGLWIRLQSFARFLHDSEARHVTEAAERGVLRQYTAWAVALDEADAWGDAVEEAIGTDPALRSAAGGDLRFVALGAHLHEATSAASTKPSSSGGGGGGGAGGGGGGGGGGSW